MQVPQSSTTLSLSEAAYAESILRRVATLSWKDTLRVILYLGIVLYFGSSGSPALKAIGVFGLGLLCGMFILLVAVDRSQRRAITHPTAALQGARITFDIDAAGMSRRIVLQPPSPSESDTSAPYVETTCSWDFISQAELKPTGWLLTMVSGHKVFLPAAATPAGLADVLKARHPQPSR